MNIYNKKRKTLGKFIIKRMGPGKIYLILHKL